jgi:hypothetical protein
MKKKHPVALCPVWCVLLVKYDCIAFNTESTYVAIGCVDVRKETVKYFVASALDCGK